MIGKTLLHYRILEKIGACGIGVVYRARTLLDRADAYVVLESNAATPQWNDVSLKPLTQRPVFTVGLDRMCPAALADFIRQRFFAPAAIRERRFEDYRPLGRGAQHSQREGLRTRCSFGSPLAMGSPLPPGAQVG
jgi:hypothetical protein